jgi:hypothetical protein
MCSDAQLCIPHLKAEDTGREQVKRASDAVNVTVIRINKETSFSFPISSTPPAHLIFLD